jgi:hypothetical protein
MMGWLLTLVLCVGAFVVGVVIGSTRAHVANARYLDQVDEFIKRQKR